MTHMPNLKAQPLILSVVQLWGLILLSLHLAAFKLPESTTWSVWPYTFFPTWLGWTLALLSGALIIPRVNEAFNKAINLVIKNSAFLYQKDRISKQFWFSLIALLAGGLFWWARLRHLRWGDSHVLSIALSYPDLEQRVIYNWQAPFTVLIHQRLWQFVANPLLGWPVENVYAAVSISCGIIFVYVLLNFMSQLGRTPFETAFLSGLILTTGSMELFFGYVENYTIISLGLLITMFLAWHASRGTVELFWPILSLSVTNAFHPSTVFLWPSMLVLAWLCYRSHYRGAGLDVILQTIMTPLFVGSGVFAIMEIGGHGLAAFMGADQPGGGDAIWFVPLFEITNQWQHYTMLSTAHFVDWGNLHLLISPFGLPLILLALGTRYGFKLNLFHPFGYTNEKEADRNYAFFLAVTSSIYVLLTFVWNADYGGQKDWDLFAPSAFIYTLLAGYLFVRILPNREALRYAGLFILAVSLLHTAAWVFANTQITLLN